MNPFLLDPVARAAVPAVASRPATATALPAPDTLYPRLTTHPAFDTRHVRTVTLTCLILAAGLHAGAAGAVDLNAASADALQALRGVGPKTAAIIVQERERAGRFESLEDLSDRVRGLGQKKVRALQTQGLRVGEPDASVSPEVVPAPRAGRAASGPMIATPVVTTPSSARYDPQHENLSHSRTNRR
ncbi:ComEA family DNA-binding protein [Schauerella aestuarii]|uniref:ComEA family DNA-binding protein n=1 Tax=Schauerella aestuarii TaxID=2511204 RepID=UPI001367D442|nr:DUF655 domain-containing protein [Achromobacter aestuarii]MYZ43220.1 DUF655 domain-containing protein [Achromobacter aestuarii]